MRARALVGVVVAVLAVLPAALAGTDEPAVFAYGHADARIQQLPLRGFTGGPITANTGETVQIFVDDDYRR